MQALSNDSMWTLAQFLEHIGKSHAEGAELWTHKILPQMHNISKWALMCAQVPELKKKKWALMWAQEPELNSRQ
jgi:hypothetical protein